MLPKDERVGPLVLALDRFWMLMTGPDGSRRESVDYKAYLKSHVRTSKTLTSHSELEDFDEDEERAVAQSDWYEDCKYTSSRPWINQAPECLECILTDCLRLQVRGMG